MLARKKRRGGKGVNGFLTLLRYVAIAVVAVMLGYGAGHLAIQVIAGRLGGPAPVQTQGEAQATTSQGQTVAETGSMTQTSSGTNTPASGQPAGTSSTTATAGSAGTAVGTTSTVGNSVPAPTSPVPNPTAKPLTADNGQAVAAVAAPKPAADTPQAPPSTTPSAGELWRVRLGRFATREEAETVLVKVRESVPQAYIVYADQYQIQAGAFSDRARAVAFLNTLGDLNLSAEIVYSAP